MQDNSVAGKKKFWVAQWTTTCYAVGFHIKIVKKYLYSQDYSPSMAVLYGSIRREPWCI